MGSTIPWTAWTWIMDWIPWTLEKMYFWCHCSAKEARGPVPCMPPGSPNTESYTCLGVIVPPTKCTYCMGEDK